MHIMPWELDYAQLAFMQLKKSICNLPCSPSNIEIRTVLNLSSYIIDWKKSQLPKDFFIQKYRDISHILRHDFPCFFRIYDSYELYGHLDFQREEIESNVDYYLVMCPDMYFNENLLSYIIESLPQISNQHFVITSQISKMWDRTWDEITHNKFSNIPYKEWDNVDIFDVIDINNKVEEIT
ncbi:MAG: hypothetical protein KC414_03760, partial [Romboutsia sp.]|nr:hypothetical protein [Romboutsia sp.]